MGRPPITAKGKLREKQIAASLDWLEANSGGGGGPSAWGSITGTLTAQTDLNTALNGKAASSHTHAQSDVTGLVADLSGKASATHSHAIADVTGLQTALDGKQASGSYAAATHSHAISDVTGLQTALDGKQASLVSATNIKTVNGSSLLGSGDLTVSGAVSRMGFSQMRPATGVFVGNTTNGTALGTQAQVANRTVAAPFVPAFDLVIDQLGVSVSTLLAGANCKVVIYAADSNGRPSTVIVESGNISAAAAATVFATISNTTLAAGTMYWIGVRSSGTQTLRTLGVGAVPVSAYTNAATPVAQSTLILTETFANAAATWSYASSQHSNALMPLVLMRLV